MSQYQNTVAFQAPSDFATEQANVDRQRKMAELLLAKSQQPGPQGQMIGNTFVAPSWTQSLSQALNGPLGQFKMNKADEKSKDIATRQRQAYADELRKFGELSAGTPEQTIAPLTPNDDEGNAMPSAVKPAMPGDRKAALAMALGAQNPALQKYGMEQMMPKDAKWEKIELPNPDGSKRVGFVNVASPDPISTFQGGGVAPVKLEGVNTGGNTTFVNPFAPKADGAPTVAATGNPYKDNLVAGLDGKPIPNAPMVQVKKDIAAAGKPQISVDARNYNTQESEQSKAYGKQLGEMRGVITQAGFDAPKKIAQLDRMEQLLAGVDGGAAAPAIADLASVANSFGVKLDPKLGNKQAAEALAIGMAGAMRQPGTGPMTDKDMDNFIRQVPGLAKTAEGRAEITKTMRASIERDQRAAKFASEYAKKNGGVIDDNYMDAIADFYAKNPVVTPKMPTNNARGKDFKPAPFDEAKEQRYQEWLRSQGK